MPYYKVIEEGGTKELRDYSHPPKKATSAIDVSYDSSDSPLSAVNVQDAIDEVANKSFMNKASYSTEPADMNDIVSFGTHTINPSVTTLNVPVSGTWAFVEVFKHGTTGLFQLWMNTDNSFMFTRTKSGSPAVWSSWKRYEQLVTSGDLSKYGIDVSGEKINTDFATLCKTLPAYCEFKSEWFGNDTTRFGTLASQIPESFGSLYIHKTGYTNPCVIEFIPYNSGSRYSRNYDYINSADHLSDWTNLTVTPSHVGQIIESTTLNTLAKVRAIYGSNTNWIQHSGYVLRGATSGVTFRDNTKTGGNDTHTLTVDEMPSHNHGGVTGGMNRSNPHYHATPSTPTWPSGTPTGHEWQVTYHAGDTQNPYGSWYIGQSYIADINHEHGIVSQGGGQAFDMLPQYKSVYIWERIQ